MTSYTGIRQPVPVWCEVVHDPLMRPFQCQPANKKDSQQNVWEYGSEINNLGRIKIIVIMIIKNNRLIRLLKI